AVSGGSLSSSAVALQDTQVARRHLELRVLPGGGYQVRDLGSGNGTLLNGQPVQSAPLRSGDTVALGQTLLLYTGTRSDLPDGADELTERVRLLGQGADANFTSAIVRTVAADMGSQILARPDSAGTDWLK